MQSAELNWKSKNGDCTVLVQVHKILRADHRLAVAKSAHTVHESISSCDEHFSASLTLETQLQEQQLESLAVCTYIQWGCTREGSVPRT